MDCSKCHKILPINNFSYKNEKNKIYYLYCDSCREKIKNNRKKTLAEKENYEFVKKTNIINCNCGITYVAFRNYHTLRHNASNIHTEWMKNILS